VYVAPPLEEIQSSPVRGTVSTSKDNCLHPPASFQLKPYVHVGVRLSRAEERAVFGNFPGPRGLTPEHFLKVAREYTQAANRLPKPEEKQQETSVDLTVTNTSVTEGGAEKPSTQGEFARS
jgi:large subunit ribosomal protein L41